MLDNDALTFQGTFVDMKCNFFFQHVCIFVMCITFVVAVPSDGRSVFIPFKRVEMLEDTV